MSRPISAMRRVASVSVPSCPWTWLTAAAAWSSRCPIADCADWMSPIVSWSRRLTSVVTCWS